MTIRMTMGLLLLVVLLLSVQIKADNKPSLYIVHFETGPAWVDGVEPNNQVGFDKHAKNLQQLRKTGIIKFGARYEQYGMIFLTTDSLQAAKELLDDDPGVKLGLFVYSISEMNVFYSWQEDVEKE